MTLFNRRGFLEDPLIILILIFALVVTGVFASKLLSNFNAQVQADTSPHAVAQQEILQQQTDDYPRSIDGMLMIIFGMGTIALIISLFKLQDNPTLFFVLWFFMLFLVGVAALLSNIWDNFISNDSFASEASRFSFAPWLMDHLPHAMVFLVLMFFLGLIIKSRGDGY